MNSFEDSDRIKSKIVISGYLSVQGKEEESNDCNDPATMRRTKKSGVLSSLLDARTSVPILSTGAW